MRNIIQAYLSIAVTLVMLGSCGKPLHPLPEVEATKGPAKNVVETTTTEAPKESPFVVTPIAEKHIAPTQQIPEVEGKVIPLQAFGTDIWGSVLVFEDKPVIDTTMVPQANSLKKFGFVSVGNRNGGTHEGDDLTYSYDSGVEWIGSNSRNIMSFEEDTLPVSIDTTVVSQTGKLAGEEGSAFGLENGEIIDLDFSSAAPRIGEEGESEGFDAGPIIEFDLSQKKGEEGITSEAFSDDVIDISFDSSASPMSEDSSKIKSFLEVLFEVMEEYQSWWSVQSCVASSSISRLPDIGSIPIVKKALGKLEDKKYTIITGSRTNSVVGVEGIDCFGSLDRTCFSYEQLLDVYKVVSPLLFQNAKDVPDVESFLESLNEKIGSVIEVETITVKK